MMNFNRSLIVAFGAALLGQLSWAQDFNQKIDLTSGTRKVPEIIAELASKTGTQLLSSNQLTNEFVFARLSGVTLTEAMNRLAETVGAEWVREGSALRLTRTPTSIRTESEWEINARAIVLQKAVASMVDDVNKTEKYGEAEAMAAMQNMQRQVTQMMQSGASAGGGARGGGRGMMQQMMSNANMMPGNRAIARLISNLDPKALAAIGAGSRVVFSNRPTRMQRPLSGNPLAIAQTYVQEQKAFNNAMQTMSGGDTNDVAVGAVGGRGGGGAMIMRSVGGMFGDPNQLTGTPFKVLLVLQRFGQSDTISVNMQIYNDQGQSMGFGFTALSPAFLPDAAQPTKPGEAEQPITLSKESLEFKKLMQQGGVSAAGAAVMSFTTSVGPMSGRPMSVSMTSSDPNQQPTKLSPEWLDRILNPEKFDPIQWLPHDIMKGIGDGLGRNMMVQVPDSLVIMMTQTLGETGPRPSEALDMMRQSWSMTVKDENGWLIARPDRPLTSIGTRANRAGLGVMLRTLQASNRLNLDQLAAFVVSQPVSNMASGFSMPYARLINQNYADQQLTRFLFGDDLMLRFYGSLNQAQKNILSNGQRLPIQGFSSDQRALLNRMVFDGMEGPQVRDPNQPGGNRAGGGRGGRGGPTGPMGGGMMMFGGSLSSERTEALANGLPGEGFLTLNIDRTPAVLASGATGTGQQMLTADRLAWTQVMTSRPEMAQFAPQANFTNYQMVTQLDYNFNFTLTPNVSLSRSLDDAVIDPKGKPVAFDQLPSSFQERVKTAAKQAQEAMEQGRQRGGGGGMRGGPPTTPPPAVP